MGGSICIEKDGFGEECDGLRGGGGGSRRKEQFKVIQEGRQRIVV